MVRSRIHHTCWPIDTTYYVDSSSTSQDLRWLYWVLQSLGLERMNKAAAAPGLNREDAYSVPMLLPPLPEQLRIAEILNRADALRAKRRQTLALLDELADSSFQLLLGDSKELLAKANRSLIDVVDPARPLTYGILMPGPDITEGVPYVRVLDMRGRGVDAEGMRRTAVEIAKKYLRSTLRSGDLLMSIRGHVGRTAIVPGLRDGANITQDTARIALTGSAEPAFVQAWLGTAEVREWLRRHTKGAAVKGINPADVRGVPLWLPSNMSLWRRTS